MAGVVRLRPFGATADPPEAETRQTFLSFKKFYSNINFGGDGGS